MQKFKSSHLFTSNPFNKYSSSLGGLLLQQHHQKNIFRITSSNNLNKNYSRNFNRFVGENKPLEKSHYDGAGKESSNLEKKLNNGKNVHMRRENHAIFMERTRELNERRDEIIPLLASPLKTEETIERFMSNSKRHFTFVNDQAKVNVLKAKLLEKKDELIVFEGTYHNMLELYNGLKRKISEYLNERISNDSRSKSLKEKYLENHISKLEFTEIMSRFGVLGRMVNGSLQVNVKKLPTLDLLDRLGNFTIEQSRKMKPEVVRSEIFIPIHTLISSIKSMDQWEKKGIELETFEDEKVTIYPHFGVYMPTRKELFTSLIKQSVNELINSKLTNSKKPKLEILDLGAGSGVFSIYVSKLISENVSDLEIKFVDINPWALECSKFNFENNFKSCNNISGKYVQVDLTSDNNLNESNDSNSNNLILCNPPWISIEKKDYEHIQNERMKFGSFKNTIDLSIFDTDYEFLDQFLNLLQNSQNKQTFGMLLVSNVGHLVGVEQISILQALEKKIIGTNIKIEKVVTLRREQGLNQELSVKKYLVDNPLSSKRKKSPHQNLIQDTKASEEVYCVNLRRID